MSRITDIADAVVAALNAETFSVEFTAERAWVPSFDLPDLVDLQVRVIPAQKETARDTRDAWADTHEMHLGVMQKLDAVTNAVIDPLVGLVQEIEDFLRGRKFESVAVTCEGVDVPVVADPLYLREKRTFQSVLVLELKGWR
ncbi:MAG TPA: hypothetical protein VMY35_19685 [Phycisphaerae bacterium]|nr:hypothetical protein [Phycisphaerae bacterium]